MPFAVTHVLLTIILVDLYRDYVAKHKKYFTLHTVFIAGFAGLLPDIDIPLNWLLSFFSAGIMHRTLTHTPFFGLIFLIPGIYLWFKKKHKAALYFIVTTIGIFFHIFLDFILSTDDGGLMLFYPLSFAQYGLNLVSNISPTALAGIDAVILLLWLWHEELRHKISDYI
jgi:hypothetical protein